MEKNQNQIRAFFDETKNGFMGITQIIRTEFKARGITEINEINDLFNQKINTKRSFYEIPFISGKRSLCFIFDANEDKTKDVCKFRFTWLISDEKNYHDSEPVSIDFLMNEELLDKLANFLKDTIEIHFKDRNLMVQELNIYIASLPSASVLV